MRPAASIRSNSNIQPQFSVFEFQNLNYKRTLIKIIVSISRQFFIYFILCIATFLVLQMVIRYSSFHDDVAFLRFKQDYLDNKVWKTAFYVHVSCSIFALLAGFTQFSSSFIKKYKKLHRLFGRIYAYNILLINVPAGMILAIYANGFLPFKITFTILDILWFYFTYKGVMAARNGQLNKHRQFMIRSYALTLSAITLRTWKIILFNTFHFDAITLYMIDAWMGFVPNLLFAEWLIKREGIRRSTSTNAAMGSL